MTGLSNLRTRYRVVAILVIIGALTSLPSAYDYFVVWPTFPGLPDSFVRSQEKARQTSRLNLTLPDAGTSPGLVLDLEQIHNALPHQSVDDLLAAAMRTAGASGRPDAVEQLAVSDDQGFHDFLALSASSFGNLRYVRTSNGFGGAGGSSSRSSQAPGMGASQSGGGGSDSSATYGCDRCDSVYGGPRLPETADVPLPVGVMAAPAVEFQATRTDDGVRAEPVLVNLRSESSAIEVKNPVLTFGSDRRDPDNPAPVPEPATLILTGLGLSGLVARHRRRKRA